VVLAASFFVVAMKTILNVFLLRIAGFDRETALVGGLSMAQIGEFSFVLAAAGFTAGALGYDIYRLSIAVTAITLLFSPAWMALMHRVEEIAMENYSSYREALAEAYHDEIENVEEGLWWVKVRYRAGRIARRKRREKKTELKKAKADEAAQKQPVASGEPVTGTDESAGQPPG
jgi:CPA2 family monovalent cation:H+ antiporter-2